MRGGGKSLRELGLNPRALGTSPRQLLRAASKRKRKAALPSVSEGREPLPKWLRFAILKRDGFRCTYCGADADNAVLQVDHVHPWSKGGSDDPSNLRTACGDCNAGKGAKLLSEREL